MNDLYDIKIEKHKSYLEHIFDPIDSNLKLDLDQKKVVVSSDKFAMVIAGAGCGKTTTMSAKVKFLIECEKVLPSDILVISYTNQAVNELKQQLHRRFQCPILISTFHHYAYHLVKQFLEDSITVFTKGEELVCDYYLSTVQNYPERKQELLILLKYYFSTDLLFKTSIYMQCMKEYFFSCGKKKYLEDNYRHEWAQFVDNYGLSIKYYAYHNQTHTHFFCKLKLGTDEIYIDYIDLPSSFYKKIQFSHEVKKREHQAEIYHFHYLVIEKGDVIEEKIINYCQENHIVMPRVPSWESFCTSTQKSTLKLLFRDLYQFILLWKRRGWTEHDFDHRINNNPNLSLKDQEVLKTIKKLYQYYQYYLQNNHQVDFEDMIHLATQRLKEKDVTIPKYIIVDEYQDISYDRFLFLKTMVEKGNAKVTVVGDDWQSIYSFAGSDIQLFTQFSRTFSSEKQEPQIFRIQKTYRNSQELIDIAGAFIMKNKKQIQKKLVSMKRLENPIFFVYYRSLKDKLKKLISILNKIYKTNPNDKVLLLSRFHHDISFIKNSKLFSVNQEHILYRNYPHMHIDFMTIHAAKGLGYDQVIILNNEDGIYGFPSFKESQPFLNLVSNSTQEELLNEERRLFYVALTRTKNHVYLLVSKENPSIFIEELKNENVSHLRL